MYHGMIWDQVSLCVYSSSSPDIEIVGIVFIAANSLCLSTWLLLPDCPSFSKVGGRLCCL